MPVVDGINSKMKHVVKLQLEGSHVFKFQVQNAQNNVGIDGTCHHSPLDH